MIIRRSDRFQRDYKKLPSYVQKQTDRKLIFFLSKIDHPSLRVKKVKKYPRFLELSITMNYRLLFRIDGDIYYLARIGKHDEILEP